MKVKRATNQDIEVGAKLIYEKDELYSAVEVHVIGFVPFYTGNESVVNGEIDSRTLCVIQKHDGSIILATDEQLFVSID